MAESSDCLDVESKNKKEGEDYEGSHVCSLCTWIDGVTID